MHWFQLVFQRAVGWSICEKYPSVRYLMLHSDIRLQNQGSVVNEPANGRCQ